MPSHFLKLRSAATMYIIIAGCRKVGSNLANVLSQENHDVVVIDSDPQNFEPLGSGFNGVTITGMPIDEDILRSAGIERADALAAVTNDDNMNVMVSQIAREIFKVPKVITRFYDPERESVFKEMGFRTICPTTLAVNEIKDILLPQATHKCIDLSGTDVSFCYVKPTRRVIGKSMAEITGEKILGIIQNGKFLFSDPQLYVHADDMLVLAEYGK
jgi:trk system potassium uptake protein TrkA